jgi:hypothetical protein
MIDARKFLRSGIGKDASFFQQDDARRKQERFAKVMRDENDGLGEALGESAEFALKLGAGHGIERAEGFVHQKDWRVGSKSTRNADALALAARELMWSAGSILGRLKPD